MGTQFEMYNKERRLEDLSDAVQHCDLCKRLCNRSKVLSEFNGSIHSRVLFIAESPGRLGADRTMIPLYGDKTGDNFNVLLSNIGWKRENIFITNAILCNPRNDNGNNSTPTVEEIENCLSYLEMTINLIEPDIIITLGVVALKALSYIEPHNLKLKEHVGGLFDWNRRKLMPLYHPGPRALIHRSLTKQRADYIVLSKLVHPQNGFINKANKKALFSSMNTSAEFNKFEQVVYTIIKSLGEATYFKITKLLYFIDLTALERLGYMLTDTIYLRQQEGPWTPELKKVIKRFNNNEIILSYRKKIPIVKLGLPPRFSISLDNEELILINDIIQKYGQMSNSSIKTAAYITHPMRYLLEEENKGRNMKNSPILYKNETTKEIDEKKSNIETKGRNEMGSSIIIKEIIPIIDYSVRDLCIKPYKGHTHGCPNFNIKKRCPPNVCLFENHFDMDKPFYAIINVFDLEAHVDRMRQRHPNWSARQLRNCLYWQLTARKNLKKAIFEFLKQNKGYSITVCPEGEGVNVFKTLKNVDIEMQWPPDTIAYQVAIAGVRRKTHINDEKQNIDFS